MIQYCLEALYASQSFYSVSMLEILSVEAFIDYTKTNIARALQNLHEIGNTGWRTLAYCASLYAIFVAIVMKIFSPKKKLLTLKIK